MKTSCDPVVTLRILGTRPQPGIQRVLGRGGEEPGGGEQASRQGSQSSRTVGQRSHCSRTVGKRKRLLPTAVVPLASRGRRISKLSREAAVAALQRWRRRPTPDPSKRLPRQILCTVTTFGHRRAAAVPNPLCLSHDPHNLGYERFRVRPAYGSSQWPECEFHIAK